MRVGMMSAIRVLPMASLCKVAPRSEAIALHSTSLLQAAVKPTLREDRAAYHDKLAAETQMCAHMGNLRGTYAVAKRL